jgi:hypothetical protein
VRHLPPPTPAELDRGATDISLPKDLKIPAEWIPYLNRAYEEYWTEGNHRPDAGFVLFARNPSKETAKLWLLRMESKAENLELLFGLVKEAQADLLRQGLVEDRFGTAPAPKAGTLPVAGARGGVLPARADLHALEFFFLFSSTCPHCVRMAETLQSFPNVKPLQVDGGGLKEWPGLPPSDRATPETIATYLDGGAVPAVVVYHAKTNRALKLTGAKSTAEVLAAAAAVMARGAEPKVPEGESAK